MFNFEEFLGGIVAGMAIAGAVSITAVIVLVVAAASIAVWFSLALFVLALFIMMPYLIIRALVCVAREHPDEVITETNHPGMVYAGRRPAEQYQSEIVQIRFGDAIW